MKHSEMAYCHLLSFLLSILLFIFISPSLSFPDDDKSRKVDQYGNAQTIGPDKIIVCQNAENECCLNIIHACAIKAWPDVHQHFKLIKCTEGEFSKSEQPDVVWRKCCDVLGFNQEPIHSCYENGEGRKLILKYANETPPHSFVPWVTLNDQALAEEFQNFAPYVCQAYKGKNLPKACSLRWHRSTVKETSILQGYYENDAREASLFAAAKVTTTAEAF